VPADRLRVQLLAVVVGVVGRQLLRVAAPESRDEGRLVPNGTDLVSGPFYFIELKKLLIKKSLSLKKLFHLIKIFH
jgi:hypothetical protein